MIWRCRAASVRWPVVRIGLRGIGWARPWRSRGRTTRRRSRAAWRGRRRVFGAICPDRAVGAAVIMPAVNTEAMNEHLQEISTQIAPGAPALLVCDGAGWHATSKGLQVPANMTLLPLPFARLCAGAEPDGERLGLPPQQHAVRRALEQLRGDRASLQHGLGTLLSTTRIASAPSARESGRVSVFRRAGISRDSCFGRRKVRAFCIELIAGVADCLVGRVDVGKAPRYQQMRLQVAPDHLDGVEFRRMLGPPPDGEPVYAGSKRCRREFDRVDRTIILNEYCQRPMIGTHLPSGAVQWT